MITVTNINDDVKVRMKFKDIPVGTTFTSTGCVGHQHDDTQELYFVPNDETVICLTAPFNTGDYRVWVKEWARKLSFENYTPVDITITIQSR